MDAASSCNASSSNLLLGCFGFGAIDWGTSSSPWPPPPPRARRESARRAPSQTPRLDINRLPYGTSANAVSCPAPRPTSRRCRPSPHDVRPREPEAPPDLPRCRCRSSRRSPRPVAAATRPVAAVSTGLDPGLGLAGRLLPDVLVRIHRGASRPSSSRWPRGRRCGHLDLWYGIRGLRLGFRWRCGRLRWRFRCSRLGGQVDDRFALGRCLHG